MEIGEARNFNVFTHKVKWRENKIYFERNRDTNTSSLKCPQQNKFSPIFFLLSSVGNQNYNLLVIFQRFLFHSFDSLAIIDNSSII